MKNAMISLDFWADKWVMDALDPSERLVYLYLLTHPKRNWAGLYEFSLREGSFHTGFDKDMIEKIIARFEKAKKIAISGDYILLMNHTKHQKITPNVEVNIQKTIDDTPTAVIQGFGIETLQKAYKDLNLNYSKHGILADVNSGSDSDTDNSNGLVALNHSEKEEWHALVDYIKHNYPNVSRLRDKLNKEQAESLLSRYTSKAIVETLDAMENHKALSKKYVSTYLTLNNWLKLRTENASSRNKGDAIANIKREDASLPELF